MKDRGKLWHFLAAFTIALVVAVGGYLREVWQHDWTLTAHQIVEAISWPAGSLAGTLAGVVLILGGLWIAHRSDR